MWKHTCDSGCDPLEGAGLNAAAKAAVTHVRQLYQLLYFDDLIDNVLRAKYLYNVPLYW